MGMYLYKRYVFQLMTPEMTTAYGFQFMILAILATRMYLYLWQVNRQTHGSGDFTDVPMSDLSLATSTA
jgi:hypothetical protein